ncbi:FAD-dependent oxidoreductase [Sphingomicrobium nitratireducens]|uniref:FAD-dependent oxidoreductase n=1 Tax=Sphingomicrobium nitratireducens TaxID=2964666 RepID=UPI00223E949D|nr:FAD-dependent oxidoreductase [Sphingomicrobium nitratireducens]
MEDAPDILIAGGGPAGMMAGLLFARAGVSVRVFEKHADFFRDFRGDTVHPSTMEILDQLGLLESFLERPHNRVDGASLRIGGADYKLGTFEGLDTPAPFIAMMPQWEFLDFLRVEAQKLPTFSLTMCGEVAGVIEEDGRVVGLRLDDGSAHRAGKLVLMADGRGSIVRDQGLLPLRSLGAPMDVLWFKIPKGENAGDGLRGSVQSGRMAILIDRGDYWQSAFIIEKGSGEAVRARGLGWLRSSLEDAFPDLVIPDEALRDQDEVKMLSVSLDRLERWWRPGLLAIGDAAHAMSPVGGVGINLAIQDAVAASNILAGPLRRGEDPDPLLAKVQARREWPTRVIQRGQKAAHDNVIDKVLAGGPIEVPLPVKLLDRYAFLRRMPGRLIGLGVRRERVETKPA